MMNFYAYCRRSGEVSGTPLPTTSFHLFRQMFPNKPKWVIEQMLAEQGIPTGEQTQLVKED